MSDQQKPMAVGEAMKYLVKSIQTVTQSGLDSDEADCYCKTHELIAAVEAKVRADTLGKFKALEETRTQSKQQEDLLRLIEEMEKQ